MSRSAEIVIAGAGLAGSALALALSRQGWQVLLLDAAETPPPVAAEPGVHGFDLRVSALSAGSLRFLDQLGVWPLMQAQRVSPFRHMQVQDSDGTAHIHFSADSVQADCLGHIVENRVSLQALRQALQKTAVQQMHGRAFRSLRTCQFEGHSGLDRQMLTLDNGELLETALLIGADGAQSQVRQQAGFRTRDWDYGHEAIVATVQLEQPHEQTAWQWFMRTGPLAFLPLDDGSGTPLVSIVWSCVPALAEQLLSLSDAAFLNELGRASEHRLGQPLAVSRRVSIPLRQSHARAYVKPGVALVADAAHSLHPLAGQGINLGLKDVAVLAEELQRALARGLSPGHPSVLARYQRRRQGDNLRMMAAMEGFKRLFAEPAPALRWLRNTGLRAVDAAEPLKQQILRQAMGL